MTHLLNNAIEASPTRRRGRRRISLRGAWRVVDIIDQGPGMTPEFVRDELFRPLRSTKGDGHGIGAYQARELLRDAGGDLLVLSRPGAGTTMRIILPSVRPDVGDPALHRGVIETRMSKPKLLIVEDDEGLCSQYRWAFPACESPDGACPAAGRGTGET